MTGAFTIAISARAERDLGRLPEKIAAACVEFIFGALVEAPYRVDGELRGELAGLRAARRGAYRVIYRIDHAKALVEVIHIDHRADVYR